eukprot:178753_1
MTWACTEDTKYGDDTRTPDTPDEVHTLLRTSHVTPSMMVNTSCKFRLYERQLDEKQPGTIGSDKFQMVTLSELSAKAASKNFDANCWTVVPPIDIISRPKDRHRFKVSSILEGFDKLKNDECEDHGMYTFFEDGEVSRSTNAFFPKTEFDPKILPEVKAANIVKKLSELSKEHNFSAIRFNKAINGSMELGPACPDTFVLNEIEKDPEVKGLVEYPKFIAEGRLQNGSIIRRILYGRRLGVDYKKFVAEFDADEMESLRVSNFDTKEMLTEDQLRHENWFHRDALRKDFSYIPCIILTFLLFAMLITLMTYVSFRRKTETSVQRVIVYQDNVNNTSDTVDISQQSTSQRSTSDLRNFHSLPDGPIIEPDQTESDTDHYSGFSTEHCQITRIASVAVDSLLLALFFLQLCMARRREHTSRKNQFVSYAFRGFGAVTALLQVISSVDAHTPLCALSSYSEWLPMFAHLNSTVMINCALLVWLYNLSRSLKERSGAHVFNPNMFLYGGVAVGLVNFVFADVSLVCRVIMGPGRMVWFPYIIFHVTYFFALSGVLINFCWRLTRTLSVSIGTLAVEQQEGTLDTMGRIQFFTLVCFFFIVLRNIADILWIFDLAYGDPSKSSSIHSENPSQLFYAIHSFAHNAALLLFLWYTWIPLGKTKPRRSLMLPSVRAAGFSRRDDSIKV